MRVEEFQRAFARLFGATEHMSLHFEDPFTRRLFDPCPDIEGFTSVKKQALLGLAVQYLGANEVYYEVGAYQGKSLVSALKPKLSEPLEHSCRKAYACDNFSEFTAANSLAGLRAAIIRHGLERVVSILDGDFRLMTVRNIIVEPVGVYFYDGAHDYDSQYQAIRIVEPLLAPTALVVVDDWRFAPDSQSHAERATRDAIARSARKWELLYELPARFNGDQAMWWNGVGVFVSRAASQSP